jgi:REP element-mobilizing transposase RayT
MPRRPRCEIENGLYHVTNRGLERRNIVRDDNDRHEWIRLLARTVRRRRWRLFAHVLLDNHFHLYFRTLEPNLSDGMHDFESSYATFFNQRHDRRGPLFQDRFHAVIVECDAHSWELSRYLHLNPVRAGAVQDPGAYRWSSYRDYLDARIAPNWLDWPTVLAEFSGTEAAARIAYRRFVEAGRIDGTINPLAAAVDGWILGSPEFVERCRRIAGTQAAPRPTLQQVVELVAAEFETSIEQISIARKHGNRAREAAIVLVREYCGESLEQVAEQFGGVSRSAITETARVAHRREADNTAFRAAVERIRARLD